MSIVFDEIEATVLPDAAPKTTDPDASGTGPGAQQTDACDLQSTLVRITERADRLRAD